MVYHGDIKGCYIGVLSITEGANVLKVDIFYFGFKPENIDKSANSFSSCKMGKVS